MKQPKKRPAREVVQTSPAPAIWRQNWLLGIFLVAITIIAYQPIWHAGFIWDDNEFLTGNPIIKSVDFKRPDCLRELWFTTAAPDYYPMTLTLWLTEWRMWGNNPLGYHLVNVLLHALSAVLLWRVFLRLKIPGAILAAALFALHPVNVESVAWISEGKNALCMFFFACTLLCWLKFEDGDRGRWYGLALAGFALTLFSKTAAAPLPVVLLGLAWWRRGRVGWKDVWRVAPFFLMAAALCCVTVWFHYHRAIGHEIIRTDNFWSRLAGAGWAVWFYLYKAVLPLNLSFVYPRWQIDPQNVVSYVPIVLVAAMLIVLWRGRATWGKGLFFGTAYFVVMLLPVLGFLNIYFMRYSLVADHWQYFAIIGPIILAAAIIRNPVLAAALLLALGALTWKQCEIYANDEVLWQKTIRLNPRCFLAYLNRGVAAEHAGHYEDAITEYRTALQIKPDYPEAEGDLAAALFEDGKVDEAISHYQTLVQTKSADAELHKNFGVALEQKGRTDEAMDQFQQALQIKPEYAEAYFNLGVAFRAKGKPGEAIAQYQKALQIDPSDIKTENNLAWLLATDADAALRNGPRALELAQQANHDSGGTNPIVLHTLAAAFAETGKYNLAKQTVQEAMDAAPAAGRKDLLVQLTNEFKRYDAGLALHP